MLDTAPLAASVAADVRFKAPAFRAERAAIGLFNALARARRRYGGSTIAIDDADGRQLSYDDLTKAALAIGGPIARRVAKGRAAGVLLPTGAGSAVAFFALSAYGRIPAMLNFTAGARAIEAALRAAEAEIIITARRFVELGGLDALVSELARSRTILYLEDLREEITGFDKLKTAFGLVIPSLVAARVSPDDVGVILFTSGTEGDAKGVALSHRNVVGNAEQVLQCGWLNRTDIIFNPLPTFHCFGLTAGLLLPLFGGMKAVLHPSPLQTKTIVERIRETKSTILFATDTFLNQYARAGADGDLASLRFVVCGAERVRDETRVAMRRKYDIEVLEGYGATEAAPIVSINPPGKNRPGTVGPLLPGMEGKIVAEDGIVDAGRLYVRGPNVMKGYIFPSDPGRIVPLAEGWHDTGDVVSVDEAGYITIRGRLKRFAKIGGEMVSLAIVENCASALWPDNRHAAVALADTKKGEQILLVTDCASAQRSEMLTWAQAHGVPELAVPRRIVIAESIPVLGTGKTDYAGVQRLATSEAARGAPSPA